MATTCPSQEKHAFIRTRRTNNVWDEAKTFILKTHPLDHQLPSLSVCPSVFPSFHLCVCLSFCVCVGMHIDLTLSHSCTSVSLVTELLCVLDNSSNSVALAQDASQNRLPFDMAAEAPSQVESVEGPRAAAAAVVAQPSNKEVFPPPQTQWRCSSRSDRRLQTLLSESVKKCTRQSMANWMRA